MIYSFIHSICRKKNYMNINSNNSILFQINENKIIKKNYLMRTRWMALSFFLDISKKILKYIFKLKYINFLFFIFHFHFSFFIFHFSFFIFHFSFFIFHFSFFIFYFSFFIFHFSFFIFHFIYFIFFIFLFFQFYLLLTME